MIQWMYYPKNQMIVPHLMSIIDAFKEVENLIDSEIYTGEETLKSDAVLSIVAPGLQRIGFQTERSKRHEDKIRVPVLFGLNGTTELAFEVDGFNAETQTVIEVEAGRGVTNYQFLKDFYEACMMQNVSYFCIAVRNHYRSSKDFEKVCKFFETLFASNRIQTTIQGILVIGY